MADGQTTYEGKNRECFRDEKLMKERLQMTQNAAQLKFLNVRHCEKLFGVVGESDVHLHVGRYA